MENISELMSAATAAVKKAAATLKTDGVAAIHSVENELSSIYNRSQQVLSDNKVADGEKELVSHLQTFVKDIKATFSSRVKDESMENTEADKLAPDYPNQITPSSPSPNIVSAFLPIGEGAGDIPPEVALQGAMPHKIVNTAQPGTEAYAAGERKIAHLRGESPENVQAAYDNNKPVYPIAKPEADGRLRDHFTGLSPNTDPVSSVTNPGAAPTMVIGTAGQEAAQAGNGLQLQPTETGDSELPEDSNLVNEELKARIQIINSDSSMTDEEKEAAIREANEDAKQKLNPTAESEKPATSKSDELPPSAGSGATESTKENVLKTEGKEGEAIAEIEGLHSEGGETAPNSNQESEKGPFDSDSM